MYLCWNRYNHTHGVHSYFSYFHTLLFLHAITSLHWSVPTCPLYGIPCRGSKYLGTIKNKQAEVSLSVGDVEEYFLAAGTFMSGKQWHQQDLRISLHLLLLQI